MFGLMFCLIIGIIITIMAISSTSEKTPNSPKDSTPTPATCNLNVNDPHDICYALSCMVGFSALRDREDRSSCLLVRIDREKMKTSIYAHGYNWISDHKNASEYMKFGVPAHIANYLTQVNFNVNPQNNALEIDFNMAAGTNFTMQKMEEGLSLLPYRPGLTQIKSYPLGGNVLKVCIDLFAAKD